MKDFSGVTLLVSNPLIICAPDTGMRRGEILTLVWDDVDYEAGLIHIKAFNTKTERERWVGMTPRLKNVLLLLSEQAAVKSDDCVFGINIAVCSCIDTNIRNA